MQKKRHPAVECRCYFTTGSVVMADSPCGEVSLLLPDRECGDGCFAPKGQYPEQQSRVSPVTEPGATVPDTAASDSLFY